MRWKFGELTPSQDAIRGTRPLAFGHEDIHRGRAKRIEADMFETQPRAVLHHHVGAEAVARQHGPRTREMHFGHARRPCLSTSSRRAISCWPGIYEQAGEQTQHPGTSAPQRTRAPTIFPTRPRRPTIRRRSCCCSTKSSMRSGTRRAAPHRPAADDDPLPPLPSVSRNASRHAWPAAEAIAGDEHHERPRHQREQRQPCHERQAHQQRHAAEEAAEQQREPGLACAGRCPASRSRS